MKHLRFAKALALISGGACGALAASSLVLATAWAQTADTPKGEMKDGYLIHQSFDLGGHVAGYSGSGAMYDTLFADLPMARATEATRKTSACCASRRARSTIFRACSGGTGSTSTTTCWITRWFRQDWPRTATYFRR